MQQRLHVKQLCELRGAISGSNLWFEPEKHASRPAGRRGGVSLTVTSLSMRQQSRRRCWAGQHLLLRASAGGLFAIVAAFAVANINLLVILCEDTEMEAMSDATEHRQTEAKAQAVVAAQTAAVAAEKVAMKFYQEHLLSTLNHFSY